MNSRFVHLKLLKYKAQLLQEFMEDIKSTLLEKEKDQEEHYLYLMKIKVLTNSLIQWLIFGSNLQMKELSSFVLQLF